MINSKQANVLLRRLKQGRGLEASDAEAVVHALIDIEESMGKVYDELIPLLLEEDKLDAESATEAWWDIREEFRHISYHIADGKLTEL
jgi:hypothetical protein